jgi:hypothetical protein
VTPRTAKMERQIRELKETVDDFLAQSQAIRSDGRFSQTYRDQELRAAFDRAQAIAGDQAKALWADARKVVEEAQKERQAAAEKAAAHWDFARLQVLQGEYAVKLSRPSNQITGDTPLSRAVALHQRMRALNDTHGLRALRHAASELISRPAQGSDVAHQSYLHQVFAEDEANELPAVVRDLDAEIERLMQLHTEGRTAVLDAEKRLEPNVKQNDPFAGASPFERDVLGEDPIKSHGGGVVWDT